MADAGKMTVAAAWRSRSVRASAGRPESLHEERSVVALEHDGIAVHANVEKAHAALPRGALECPRTQLGRLDDGQIRSRRVSLWPTRLLLGSLSRN